MPLLFFIRSLFLQIIIIPKGIFTSLLLYETHEVQRKLSVCFPAMIACDFKKIRLKILFQEILEYFKMHNP